MESCVGTQCHHHSSCESVFQVKRRALSTWQPPPACERPCVFRPSGRLGRDLRCDEDLVLGQDERPGDRSWWFPREEDRAAAAGGGGGPGRDSGHG
ncbi:hypothetical protein FKM82_019347 [Ascaphus truei]